MFEWERGLLIKVLFMSLVFFNIKGKFYFVNIIDILGYVDFVDEVVVVFWLVDGVCLVVDVVEGV